MVKRKEPKFGETVAYWPKSVEDRIPAIVCGVLEDKAGVYWCELRPVLPPSICPIFRDTDENFKEVPHGLPGQPATWTFLDEVKPEKAV